MKRLLMIIALLLAVFAITLPAGAQAGNLLNNPGFESTSYTFISADPQALAVTYSAPSGWGGGVVTGGGQPWQNVHPSGFPHNGPYKLQGNSSFHMARGGGTFTAYIYQQVSVAPNTPVEGGAWAFIENGSGTAIARVGIDPTGGTNPFSGAVVWSGNGANGFNWNRMSVSATAQGGTVTLFLFATQSFPVDPNGVYWDEAFLYGNAGSGQISNPAAPAAPTGRIATPRVRLNVRSGAGTNYDRITIISPGESYGVVNESGGWVQIDLGGRTGYVSSAYVTISGGTPSNNGGGSVVQPPAGGVTLQYTLWYNVVIRNAPDRSAGEVVTVPANTVLQAVGRTGDSNWVRVNFNGQSGWMASWLGRWSGRINDLPVLQ